MGSVKSSLVAAAAALVSTGAIAADLSLPPPHPVEEFGAGWYLRGDLGFSNQQVSSVTNPGGNPAINPAIISVVPNGLGFDSAPIFDVGSGYRGSMRPPNTAARPTFTTATTPRLRQAAVRLALAPTITRHASPKF